MTCWRRLLDWTDAGVRQRLHEVLLGKLRAAEQLNMSRAVIDGTHIRALKGGPNPKTVHPGQEAGSGATTRSPSGERR